MCLCLSQGCRGKSRETQKCSSCWVRQCPEFTSRVAGCYEHHHGATGRDRVQQLLCASVTRLPHKMGGGFPPTQWAGCDCGWSAGIGVSVPLWVWSVPENVCAARYRKKSTPHPFDNSLMAKLGDSRCHLAKDPGHNNQALDWDLMILYAVMAYRTTKHSATGFTPNFMMFGRE